MKRYFTVAAVTVGVLALAACAKPDPNSPSGKRHAAYEKIGDANKVLKGLFDGPNPDLAAAAPQVAIIKAQVALLPTLFPAGSGPDSKEPTDAKAEIWAQPAAFAKELDGLKGAVDTLDAAVGKRDGAAASLAYGELGKTCKSCHSKFKD